MRVEIQPIHEPLQYQGSDLIEKLLQQRENLNPGERLKIAVFDLDATLTAHKYTGLQSGIEAGIRVRELLDEQHIPAVAITSRTEEMPQTSYHYAATSAAGETERPPVLYGVDAETQERVYVRPEDVPALVPLIGFDEINAQTGGTRHLLRDGIYVKDRAKEERASKGRNWREDAMRVLENVVGKFQLDEQGNAVNPTGEYVLSAIEIEGAYEQKKVDVQKTEFRIQVNTVAPQVVIRQEGTGASSEGEFVSTLQTEIAVQRKQQLVDMIRTYKNRLGSQAYHLQVASLQEQQHSIYESLVAQREVLGEDEFIARCKEEYSTYRHQLSQLQKVEGEEFMQELAILENITLIDDSNPDKGKCGVYIVPKSTGKDRAMRETLLSTAEAMGIDPNEIQIDYFGDSYPDLELLKTLTHESSLVLVGGSRLTQPLLEAYRAAQQGLKDKHHFANEGLTAIGRRLIPAYDSDGNIVDGIMYFVQPLTGNVVRLVLTDVSHPIDEDGNEIKEAQSVLAYQTRPINTHYDLATVKRYRKNDDN